MSSVLVKGMKMPRGCIYEGEDGKTKYCILCNHADIPFCTYIEDEPEAAIGIDERPCYCPLVALPDKHGRLVDADAFKADYGMNADCADCEKECQGKSKACEYDRIYSKMDFCEWLDVADTIVEAEE